jgi:hypothetical protein
VTYWSEGTIRCSPDGRDRREKVTYLDRIRELDFPDKEKKVFSLPELNGIECTLVPLGTKTRGRRFPTIGEL